jgi:transketolase
VTGNPVTHRDRVRVAELAHQTRVLVVDMCCPSGQGYAGQGMELADILACLYGSVLRRTPDGALRDRFVLSTGHSAIGLFAVLGALGQYEREELLTYGSDGSRIEESPLSGTPGFEITGGSLGQGLSQALGIALGARITGTDTRVYCEVSDGELQEGQVWEAVMAASHHRVGNLVMIVDHNDMQADGRTAEIMAVEPVHDRLAAFGWSVERIDGHDIDAILDSLARAVQDPSRPAAVICDTVPGKGSPTLESYRRVHYIRAEPEVWESARRDLLGGR